MHRIDLHTHSEASPDGGLRLRHYQRLLERGQLHTIAITDHDTISFAQTAQSTLGDRIIVGQEITTSEGELIGLYLTEPVPPRQSALATARAIHAQGGLVYVPHPFETVRHGLSPATLGAIAPEVDIIEVYNGRAWLQKRSAAAHHWAGAHHVATAAASDAHGPHGWGRTYTILTAAPTRDTLVDLLENSQHNLQNVGAFGLLYPKRNRLRKLWKQS